MKITFRDCFREYSHSQHELQDCVFEENLAQTHAGDMWCVDSIE